MSIKRFETKTLFIIFKQKTAKLKINFFFFRWPSDRLPSSRELNLKPKISSLITTDKRSMNSKDQGVNKSNKFTTDNLFKTLWILWISFGMISVFPEGLTQFVQKQGCDTVVYLSAFDHEDPGVISLATRLFSFPEESIYSRLQPWSWITKFLLWPNFQQFSRQNYRRKDKPRARPSL